MIYVKQLITKEIDTLEGHNKIIKSYVDYNIKKECQKIYDIIDKEINNLKKKKKKNIIKNRSSYQIHQIHLDNSQK